MSGISFFIFTFWLQKFLEAIFYCIDFLLDFQETVWVAFFIYSQWLSNHINKTSSSRFYALNRTRSVVWALNCKIRWQKEDVRTFK